MRFTRPGDTRPARATRRVARAPRWHAANRLNRGRIPPDQRRWVLADGSLTAHVRALCPGRFHLRVLRQRRARPCRDEARALRLRPGSPVLLREVALCCGDTPLVLARTIIPAATLRGRRQRLARQGSRPLGALLFTDRSVSRGPFAIARLSPAQAGIAMAPRGTGPVWARRAVFRLGGASLLVSELFLPPLFEHVPADGDASAAGRPRPAPAPGQAADASAVTPDRAAPGDRPRSADSGRDMPARAGQRR